MYILHGTWFPGDKPDFENTGRFVLWVERQISGKAGRNAVKHPGHLEDEELRAFFSDVLPLSKPLLAQLHEDGINVHFVLPGTKDGPLPSFEMAMHLGMDLPDKFEWKSWRVNCLAVNDSLLFLKELHFLVQYYSDRVIPGRDLIFWYHFGWTVFVLSLKAGGTGITLTKASHVFHFDRWWNPAVENQATDRAFRIGQTKKVFVHKMVTIGTLEERIDQMLEEKQRLAESITGSDESWLTELDDTAFRELITLSRNAVLE